MTRLLLVFSITCALGCAHQKPTPRVANGGETRSQEHSNEAHKEPSFDDSVDDIKKRAAARARARTKLRRKVLEQKTKLRQNAKRQNTRQQNPRVREAPGVDRNPTHTSLRIIESARQKLGARYLYAGKGPSYFDCSGFVHFVFNQNNVSVTGSTNTQKNEGHALATLNELRPGDLVFFRRSGRINHVAIVTSTDEGITVIHATTSRGVIEENISRSKYWNPKIAFARRILSD